LDGKFVLIIRRIVNRRNQSLERSNNHQHFIKNAFSLSHIGLDRGSWSNGETHGATRAAACRLPGRVEFCRAATLYKQKHCA